MEEVIKVEDCGENIGDYDIPIHNAIIIPRDATNGDMIEATGLFEIAWNLSNDMRICASMNGLVSHGLISFSKAWWDAPYKRMEG